VSEVVSVTETNGEVLMNALRESVSLGLQWVYTCGLGEPLEDNNFWEILHYIKTSNVRMSMFTNGIFITDVNVARELKECNVNIILKVDTFDECNFNKILGRPNVAAKIYAARDYLLSAGYAQQDKYTDLAFSIVPTSLAYNGISEVVNYCKKYKIFASIGELEYAGAVVFSNLKPTLDLTQEQVANVRAIANEYCQGYYMRPICPCIMTGLHIDNCGNVIVDRLTGLNCKWFMLHDPDIVIIGSIYETPIKELFDQVIEYRKSAFRDNTDAIAKAGDVSYAFGGCGGNPKHIIELARSIV